MRSTVHIPRLAGVCITLCLATVIALFPTGGARGHDKPAAPKADQIRPISYLKEIRPILAQHCFQCHGPDPAARKGKLRLDLKDTAYAARDGKHIIAGGSLPDSLVWQRITAHDESERMPPSGSVQPLTEKQISAIKS